jgi:hypothetical protein
MKWKCKRCKQIVNPETFKCGCIVSPSPWEPVTEKEIDWEVTICDGKYTVQHWKNGGGEALRYGEKWRDLVGDNLVIGLALEVYELREKLSKIHQQKLKPDKNVKVPKFDLKIP